MSDREVKPLTREQAVERPTAAEPEIRALGVARLALFGSVLRGEARADSDVDPLVEFERGPKTYRHFLALSELLELRLGRRVELVTPEALSPFIGPHILSEAQDVLRPPRFPGTAFASLPSLFSRAADLRTNVIGVVGVLRRRGMEIELPLPGESQYGVFHLPGSHAVLESGFRSDWVTAKL